MRNLITSLRADGALPWSSAPSWRMHLFMIPLLTLAFAPNVQAEPNFDISMVGLSTQTGKVDFQVSESGGVNNLFDKFPTLLKAALTSLGKDPALADKMQPPTRNFKSFVHFSVGLHFRDQGRMQEARTAFLLAAQEDPGFELAVIEERKTARNESSLGEMRANSKNVANRVSRNIRNNKTTATPRPTAPQATTTNNETTPTETTTNDDISGLVADSLKETQRISDRLNQLKQDVQDNPEEAAKFLGDTLGADVPPEMALEAVLGNLKQPSKEVLSQLVQEAAANGLTVDGAKRAAASVRGSSPCP